MKNVLRAGNSTRAFLVLVIFAISFAINGCANLKNISGKLAKFASDDEARFGKITSITKESGIEFYNLVPYEYFHKQSPDEIQSQYLKPGDEISIIMTGDTSDKKSVAISDNYTFDFLGARDVSVTNKTIPELESELKQKLSLIYPNANISIKRSQFMDDNLDGDSDEAHDYYAESNRKNYSGQYKIYGLVKKPGYFNLETGMKLSQAITRAGGIIRRDADLGRSVFIRTNSGNAFLPINFTALIERNDFTQDIPLKDGDLIIITNKPFDRIDILGAVRKPNTYPIASANTIANALAISGGLTENSAPKNALLIRGSIINTRVAPINLNPESTFGSKQSQQLYSTPLKEGDIIYIPDQSSKKYFFRTLLNDMFTAIAKHSTSKSLSFQPTNINDKNELEFDDVY